MFTGDRSGEFLYRSLYRAGFASQPESRDSGDGLELRDAWITAAGHCAPPDNKPTPEELRNCRPFFLRELELLSNVRLVVALGKIAMDTYLRDTKGASRYRFGHGALHSDLQPPLLCSYHPSQQNTSTGRLDPADARRHLYSGARDRLRLNSQGALRFRSRLRRTPVKCGRSVFSPCKRILIFGRLRRVIDQMCSDVFRQIAPGWSERE